MKIRHFFLTACLILLFNSVNSQEVLEWRGADRTGLYHETGLLQSWPEDGPELLWEFAGLGNGYSRIFIMEGKVYILAAFAAGTVFFITRANLRLHWLRIALMCSAIAVDIFISAINNSTAQI